LIIKIQGFFQFEPSWRRSEEVRDLMLQYYFVLRSVLSANPCLRRCLARCRHCGVFFLTHPRNAGRKDLGCPFGCKDAHRIRGSANRSIEYYRTPEGKSKKKRQNRKRSGPVTKAVINEHPQAVKDLMSVALPERRIGEPMLCYLRMAISLIEDRRVSAEEILEMLARTMRQHSIVRRRKIDYILQHLNKRAP
jgi:hypothetical protein